MTRETTVGLFIGLAFIIVFAMIMSDRGTPPQLADFGAAADGDALASGERRIPAARDEGRLPVETALPNELAAPGPVVPVRTPREAPDRRWVDARNETLPRIPRAQDEPASALAAAERDAARNAFIDPDAAADVAELAAATPVIRTPAGTDRVTLPPAAAEPDGAREDAAAANAGRAAAATPGGAGAVATGSDAPHEVLTEFSAEASATPRSTPRGIARSDLDRLAASLDERANRLAAPKDPSRGAAASEGPGGMRFASHTVSNGETLSGIAQRYFGSTSPKIVAAIYDANRRRLPNRNSLKVGQSIVIPVVEGLTPRGPVAPVAPSSAAPSGNRAVDKPGSTKVASKARADAAPKGPRTAWTTPKAKPAPAASYHVRGRDTLSEIAARELGSAKRAAELYRLNRDRLKHPDDLRAGIELRLPPRTGKNAGRSTAAGEDGVAASG